MIPCNITIKAEALIGFFKNLGKKRLNASEKIPEKVLKIPSRALDITANLATAAVSKSPKNVLKTPPEVINFYHNGLGDYLIKFI